MLCVINITLTDKRRQTVCGGYKIIDRCENQ